MNTVTYKQTISANDIFKSKYNRHLRWSLIGAVVFTLLFFLFSPKYTPNPYRLRDNKMEMVEVQEAPVVPPPPQSIPKPPVNIEAAMDDEVDEDVEIADTLLDAEDVMADMFSYEDGGDGAFEVSQEKPTLKSYSSPDYPEMARASQLEGTVVVKVQVGTDGTVIQAVVIQSVHPILDREAIKAAQRCKFNPGKQRGIAVKAWMAIPFAFSLN